MAIEKKLDILTLQSTRLLNMRPNDIVRKAILRIFCIISIIPVKYPMNGPKHARTKPYKPPEKGKVLVISARHSTKEMNPHIVNSDIAKKS